MDQGRVVRQSSPHPVNCGDPMLEPSDMRNYLDGGGVEFYAIIILIYDCDWISLHISYHFTLNSMMSNSCFSAGEYGIHSKVLN